MQRLKKCIVEIFIVSAGGCALCGVAFEWCVMVQKQSQERLQVQ